MSAKNYMLEQFRHARTEHIKWLNRVKLLVSGFSQEDLDIDQSGSMFGKWLFNDAMVLSSTHCKHTIDEIMQKHTECFDYFLTIYHLQHRQKGNFLENFFIGRHRLDAREEELIKRYYEDLVTVSDRLLVKLRLLESQLLAMNETDFEVLEISTEQEVGVFSHKSSSAPSYYRGQRID